MIAPIVSIIIPFYNAESSLERCLDSVLIQTYREWECILIDDGSQDNSKAISDEYAARDARFRVFHKNNGGVSSARNLGLDNARGEWITFLDADDAFGEGYLEAISGEIYQDLVIVSYQRTDNTTVNLPNDGIFEANEAILFYEQNLASLHLRTPWAKFFKRGLIDSHRFDESLYLGEDTHFCQWYYAICRSIRVDNTKQYLYTTSNTKTKYCPDPDYILYAFDLLVHAYDNLGIDSELYNLFLYNWFRHLLSDSQLLLRKWYSNKNVRLFYMKHFADTIRKKLSFYKQWIKTYT